MSTIIINTTLSIMGVEDVARGESDLFYNVAQESQKSWGEDTSPEKIIKDLKNWGIPSKSGAVTAALYNGENQISVLGEFPGSGLLETAMTQPENRHFTMDHEALYSMPVGQYWVFILNTSYEYGRAGYVDDPDSFPIVELICVGIIVLMIFVTNRLLTHFVFKSISLPLDILINGVHKIRDGDLDYRIEYKGKNEFSSVCAAFNEMASQIQELMEAKRRDEKNRRELIAGISHDLRTPLTAIVAYAEGLTSGVITDPVMKREYLDIIAERSKDLEHIVSQLFQFSKLDIGDFPVAMTEVKLKEELEKYIRGVQNEYAQRGLQIIMDDIPNNVKLRIDPVQLRSVFTNLLENSVKYGRQENSIVRITCKTEGPKVIIAFTDNGPGIPDEQLDNLFGAFYRTDRARSNPEGSGLGLAISERIIHLMDGEIYAENASESGLRVIITLPIINGRNET